MNLLTRSGAGSTSGCGRADNACARSRWYFRPSLLALAIVAAAAFVFAGHAYASTLLQDAPPAATESAARILDLLDQLSRLVTLVAPLIPLTEIRRGFGGLPNIPLPGGHVIRAGRWVSWVVAGILVSLGHRLGWLQMPAAFESFQAWWAIEVAVLGIVANAVYTRYFAPKPELQPIEGMVVGVG